MKKEGERVEEEKNSVRRTRRLGSERRSVFSHFFFDLSLLIPRKDVKKHLKKRNSNWVRRWHANEV